MTTQDVDQDWSRSPKKFFFETITGTAIFCIIAAAAVGLSLVVVFLESKGIDPFILYGLKLAEYSLFTLDLILFFRFLWRTGKRTWGEL